MRQCQLCAAGYDDDVEFCPMCGMASGEPAAAEVGEVAEVREVAEVAGQAAPVAPGGDPTPEQTAASWTLTIAQPVPPAVATVAPKPAFKMPSRKTALLIAAALVLVVGGITTYQLLQPTPPSASSAVSDYFSALESGNAAGALKLVDQSSQGTGGDPLLVAGAIAQPADRPSGLKIVSTETVSQFAGPGVTSVAATYQLGGTQVSQVFDVVKNSGSGSKYLLESPFVSLDFGQNSTAGRPVVVNGVTVAADQASGMAGFPALYHATVAATPIFAGEDVTASVGSGTGSGPTMTFNLPQPALASGATAAVQAQVKQLIDQCAASTSTTNDQTTQGCPFGGYDVFVPGTLTSIKWTVTTYPNVTVTAATFPSAGDQADISDDNQDGTAHWVAGYTDFSGAAQTTSGDQSFGFTGTATVTGGQIQVTGE